MRTFTKFICFITFLAAGVFSAPELHAQIPQQAIAGILNAAMDPSSIPTTLIPGSFSAVLCSIRLIVCGKLAVAIVATALFLLGMLIMTKKIRWPYAILIISMIILFLAPQNLVKVILVDFMGLNVAPLGLFGSVCTCTIVNQIPWS